MPYEAMANGQGLANSPHIDLTEHGGLPEDSRGPLRRLAFRLLGCLGGVLCPLPAAGECPPNRPCRHPMDMRSKKSAVLTKMLSMRFEPAFCDGLLDVWTLRTLFSHRK